jgi:hypothetical protein
MATRQQHRGAVAASADASLPSFERFLIAGDRILEPASTTGMTPTIRRSPSMRALALAGLVALAPACDDASETCDAAPGSASDDDAQWRAWNNALSMNGIVLNAMSLNALSLNGFDLGSEGVRLEATRIVDADGVPLSDETLVGAELPGWLSDGTAIALRIDAVRHEDGLTYYTLSYEDENLCGEGMDGLFLGGTWDETGAHHEDEELVSYSCTAGVIAKCVGWGYQPWTVGADLHQSCTRMARADYCGDGVPYTRDGTEIDIFDDVGVLQPTADADGFEFEAAWGPDGATCVSRPRYDEQVVGVGEILPHCWDALPRCESLSHAQALSEAHEITPQLANSSVPTRRLLCEAQLERLAGATSD